MDGVIAKFLGMDYGFRLYNIEGPHPMNGSTVSIKTLVDEGIDITDLSPEQVDREYKRIEQFLREEA